MSDLQTASAPAAPAQPATPAPVISATRAAAEAGDFSAFDKAHTSAREGNPLPDVAVKAEPSAPAAPKVDDPAPAAPAQPERTVSKRQLDTNEAIRQAVERAVGPLQEEIARLRGTAPAPAAAPPAKGEPEWKRYAAMPDAPKLEEFDSVAEHTAAMSHFIAKAMLVERAEAAQQSTERTQIDRFQAEQVQSFDTRVNELAKTDPEIASKVVPVAQELGALGAKGGPYRFISDLVLGSEHGPELLRDHRDALLTLGRLPERYRGLPLAAAVQQHRTHITREIARLEAGFAKPTAAAPVSAPVAAPSPITAAPPPPPSIGKSGSTTDPKRSAIERGDFAAFDKAERAERMARRRTA